MAVWLDVLSQAHGLRCASGDMSKCSGRCEHKAGFYLGQQWERCPVAELHSDGRLLYVMKLEAQSKLSPICGWPDDFAAWVPRLWQQVEVARADRMRHNGGR